MAQAPKTRCPRCKQIKQGRCVGCAAASRRKRPEEKDQWYSNRRWRALRAAFLADNPLCEHCHRDGRIRAAEEVDHIKPRQGAPELEYEPSNLQGLCKAHHSRKTNRERAARAEAG